MCEGMPKGLCDILSCNRVQLSMMGLFRDVYLSGIVLSYQLLMHIGIETAICERNNILFSISRVILFGSFLCLCQHYINLGLNIILGYIYSSLWSLIEPAFLEERKKCKFEDKEVRYSATAKYFYD